MFPYRDIFSLYANIVLTLNEFHVSLLLNREVSFLAISYNLLWKLLIDKGMNKSQLKEQANISSNALAKLGKNEPVSLDTIQKICVCLNCEIGEVMEVNAKYVGNVAEKGSE